MFMAFLRHFSFVLGASIVLVLGLSFQAQAQNRVVFSLQNRGIVGGNYHAELWATVSSGATWTVGNCLINIRYNSAGLSVGSFDNVGVLNADPALNSGSYLPMTQSTYGNDLAIDIINFFGNFASKTGSFRIGTLRWQILNGFQQDSISLYTPNVGPDSCIIMQNWESLSYNCGDTTCYAATIPSPLQIGSPAVITSQPQTQMPCMGESAQFSVQATGEQLTYQWQKLNGAQWENITGATSNFLSFNAVSFADSGSYRIAIMGDSPPLAISNVVTLSPQTAPSFTLQPNDATTCNGGSATFTVAVTGIPTPTVTWQVSSDNGFTWQVITASTGTELTLPSVEASLSGNRYRAVATNQCGAMVSTPATLFVSLLPTITAQPQATMVMAGETASLSATATGTNLAYQWQKNFENIPGATSATLSIANAQQENMGLYRLIASGICAPPDTSDNAVLFVQPSDNNLARLNIKVFMQGYWNGTKHARTPVSVEIRSGTTPMTSTLTALQTGLLSSSGTISVAFSNISSGPYWIIVRHGGYLAIASGSAVSLSPGTTVDYDFTNAAAKAYANSTIVVSINGTQYYVLKAGDFNGDIAVNPYDFPHLLTGYSKTNAVSIPGL